MSELARYAGRPTRRRCLFLLPLLLIVTVFLLERRHPLDRVLPPRRGCAHWLDRLLCRDDCVLVARVCLGSDGLGREQAADEGVHGAGAVGGWRIAVAGTRATEEGNEVGVDGVQVLLEEALRRIRDRSTVVVDGERREAGAVHTAGLERGVVGPALGDSLHHRVVGLAGLATSLIVHDVDEATRAVMEESYTFGVVEVGNVRNETRDALVVVLLDMRLKQAPLDEVQKTLIRVVDAELVQGVRTTRHVLWTREIEETDEVGEVVTAQPLVDVLVQPCEEEGVQGLREFVSVVRRTIGVEEHSAQLLLDQLRLVRQSCLQRGRLHAQELRNNLQDVEIAHNGGILVSMAINRELQVTEVKDGGDELTCLCYMPLGEAHVLEGDLQLLETRCVLVLSLPDTTCRGYTRTDIAILRLLREVHMLAFFRGSTGKEVIEDVEVALA